MLKAFWTYLHFVEDQLKLICSSLTYFDMKNILTYFNSFADLCFVSFWGKQVVSPNVLFAWSRFTRTQSQFTQSLKLFRPRVENTCKSFSIIGNI